VRTGIFDFLNTFRRREDYYRHYESQNTTLRVKMAETSNRKRDRHDVDDVVDDDDDGRWTDNVKRQRRRAHSDYTVGWVCALPIELAAARGTLDEIHSNLFSAPNDSNSYTLGSIGLHNVVITCLPLAGYGTNNAAEVASNMHRTFQSLRVCFLVGIGGGLPGKVDVRLGDVVVSTSVVQHDLGKTIEGGRSQRTSIPRLPPPALSKAVSKLQAVHVSEPSKIPSILSTMFTRFPAMANYTRQDTLEDWLFQSTYSHLESEESCKNCDQSRLVKRPARSDLNPRIHYGVIASGNQVIKDATTRDQLARELSAICIEMEAAGLMDNLPCLVIRGICDYSDSHKNKRWQEYAAATAAAYAKELLSVMEATEVQNDSTAPGALSSGRYCYLIFLSIRSNPIVEHALRDRRKTLMASLGFDEMNSRRSTIKSAYSTTCEWILRHSDYVDWLDVDKHTQHHGFLWVNGKPGAGKSTLMKYAYTDTNKRTTKDNVCISFFFNARGDDLEKSTIGMYRYLLFQLLKTLPDLQEVLDGPDMFPGIQPAPSEWRAELLCDLFSAAIAKLGSRRFTCFIDALDECDEQQVRDMVEYFEGLAQTAVNSGSKVYICFSSRHYPTIDITTGLQLTLEDQPGHGEDLAKYVRTHLRAGKGKNIEQVRAQILEKSNGVFMWAVLVVDILNEEFRRGRIFAVKKRLQEIPPKLSDLFKDILMRDNANMPDLLLCIQWILFARRPLRREEFYFALVSGLDPDLSNMTEWDSEDITIDDMDRFVLNSSKGLAELTRSKFPAVQFIHESVRDFLIKDNGLQQLWPELGDLHAISHDRLKQCCSAYMRVDVSGHVDFNENLPRASTEEAKALRDRIANKFPFLEYATKYMLYHSNEAAERIPQAEFLDRLPLRTWINYSNLFERFNNHRHTIDASLLYLLAEQNLPRLIRLTCHHNSSINIEKEQYQYPLFAALANGHRDAVKALLQLETSPADSDITLQLEYGKKFSVRKDQTPLSWSSEKGHEAMVKLLLEQGAVVETKDRRGQTPLWFAARNGHEAIVKLLLEQGAVIEPGYSGEALLLFTAEKGHEAIVKLLLEHGANVKIKDDAGRTPLSFAAENGHAAIEKLLLEHGAIVETKDAIGRTPLWFAARDGHEAIVKLLLEYGAIVNINGAGWTPLSVAAENGRDAVVKLLLEHGAIVETKDAIGKTPLWLAARYGHEAIVKLLLEHGAKVVVLQ
jgi:ankyrin repeat protein/nucleoside phosphorylase